MARKKVTRKGICVHNDLDTINCGGDQFKKFKFGDVAWIRTSDLSWWPAQVVDEGSVNFHAKKKPKNGVLVRIYGGSEYLYVDPVKCRIEFGNFLKQENINVREAFEQALEKDVIRVSSGGKSKRKVSESKAADAPKGKRRRHFLAERIEVEDPAISPGAFSSELEEEVALGNETWAKGIKAKRSKQGETTKLKVFKRTRGGVPKFHGVEQEWARMLNVKEKTILGTKKIKGTYFSVAINVKRASNGRVSTVKQTPCCRASRVTSTKEGVGKTSVKGKASRETSKMKGTSHGGASIIKETHRRGASKVNGKAQLGKGKLNVKGSRETSKVKGTSRSEVSKSKRTSIRGASRVKSRKNEGNGMSSVEEKASRGTSKAKRAFRLGVSKVKRTPHHKSSRVKGAKQGTRKSNLKEKSTRGISRVKGSSRGRVSRNKETPLREASKVTKTLKVHSKVRKTKQESGKNKLATKATKGDPKTRGRTQASSKLKTKNVREKKKEKSENVKSRKEQNGMTGKANISVKTNTGMSRSKTVKQSALISLKDDEAKEHARRKGSPIAKRSAPEQSTPNFSERRTKVMQRLGLIAPLGSPFH